MTCRQIDVYRKKWNVPNWRIAKAYPKFEDLELRLWRWEFLRRRPDYRRDWGVWSVKTYEKNLKYREYLMRTDDPLLVHYPYICKPDHPQFRANMPGPLKYGLFALPDPAVRVPSHLSFVRSYGKMIFGKGGELLSGTELDCTVIIPQGKVVVYFDLTCPLPKQIKLATKNLKEWQQHKHGNVKQRRAVSKRKSTVRAGEGALWPLYLRLIDARNEDVSFEEIGRCLLQFDPYEGNVSDQAKPRAKALHSAAVSLSLNFPD